MALYGAIEAGGTKFVCLVASDVTHILAEVTIPTGDPGPTLSSVAGFFQRATAGAGAQLDALGLGCFGPLDVHPESPTFGTITSTPKVPWRGFNIRQALQTALKAPVFLDTDVNAAALGEATWGAARGLTDFLYLTVGTGVGGGALVNGRPLHGLTHAEMGHVLLPHDLTRDPFPGVCPYHGDCFEGLASGPALRARWGQDPEDLPEGHPGWQLEARYIAQALMDFVLTLSPQKVILGGGVMHQRQLFPLIRSDLLDLLRGYVQSPAILDQMDEYVVPPGLGDRSGVLGALALAMQGSR
jgi:fructokinase